MFKCAKCGKLYENGANPIHVAYPETNRDSEFVLVCNNCLCGIRDTYVSKFQEFPYATI